MGQRDAEGPRSQDTDRAAYETTQPAFRPPTRHPRTPPGRHARVPSPPPAFTESTEPLPVVDPLGEPPPVVPTTGSWRRRERLIIGIAVAAAAIAVVVATTIIVSNRGSQESAGPSASVSTAATAVGAAPEGTPIAAPPPPPASPAGGLASDFQQFAARLDAKVGVVVGAVGGVAPTVSLGEWQSGPAWSTIKVPLSIAGLRASGSADPTAAMRAAITESDNAAAEQVWQSLGPPEVAATKVGEVLSAAGAPTTVQSQKVRPEFTAFGQTDWSLTNQVRFLSSAKCTADAGPIFSLMGQVEGDQRWGLGSVANAEIKGGWGPSLSGAYLVRQIAVIPTPHGQTAVAIAAEPTSGSFGDGTQILTQLANWLVDHAVDLPGGQCSAPS